MTAVSIRCWYYFWNLCTQTSVLSCLIHDELKQKNPKRLRFLNIHDFDNTEIISRNMRPDINIDMTE